MKPGECHDCKSRPVYPGDLLKSFHFIGARRKRYYIYHTAVFRDGYMWMVPTSHLEPTKQNGGGTCRLEACDRQFEIIEGYGPGSLSFEDRKKA